MFKIYRSLFVSLAVLAVGALTSCRETDTPADPATVPSATVVKSVGGDEQFMSTSAKFTMTTNMVEKCAYIAVEGTPQTKPDAEVVYMDAKEHVAITNPKQDIMIYGLDGGKTYTVYFVFKIKDQNKYLMQSVEVTTPAYTRTITVIDLGYDFVRIHVDVPTQDTYYRFGIGDRALYEKLKDQWKNTDMDIVTTGLICKGDTTFYLKNGDVLLDYGGDDNVWRMECNPGMRMYVLLAECDSTGFVDYVFDDSGDMQQQRISADRPGVESYTDKVDDKYVFFDGIFARQFFTAKKPILSTEEFKITEKITERQASFEITPPPSVIGYGVNIVEGWVWDIMLKHAGEEGVMEFAFREMAVQKGPILFQYSAPLIKDTSYKLIVIGICDDQRTMQVHYVKDFKAIVSSKPVIPVDITHVEHPQKDPFRINFNVKAKGSKVTHIKYLFNYVADWNSMLNSGNTYESMFDKYGVAVNSKSDAEIISKINSAEGYEFSFNTWENRDSRIAIQTFNEDDKAAIYTCNGTSLKEQPKERVESPLFESLLGDWTATITFKARPESETMTSIIKTTIAKGPEGADPKFFDAGNAQYKIVYDYYFEQGQKMDKEDPDAYAKEQIAIFHKEFVDLSALYHTKYRDQNRLVMRNVQVNTHPGFSYKGAWDLLCDPTYNSYNTDEIFFDYGPKMFIEIGKDESGKDKLWIPTNPSTIAQFQAHNSDNPTSLIGSALNNEEDNYGGNFDVTIVDADNVKISHKFIQDQVEYLMSFYATQWGFASRITLIVEDITLKRGFTPIVPQIAPCPIKSMPLQKDRAVIKRTAFKPSNVPERKFETVKIPQWSYEKAMSNSAAFKYLKKRMK